MIGPGPTSFRLALRASTSEDDGLQESPPKAIGIYATLRSQSDVAMAGGLASKLSAKPEMSAARNASAADLELAGVLQERLNEVLLVPFPARIDDPRPRILKGSSQRFIHVLIFVRTAIIESF
jgi:hypothetical protein